MRRLARVGHVACASAALRRKAEFNPNAADADATSPEGTDRDGNVPGDSYGLYETRQIFTQPVPRHLSRSGVAAELFNDDTPPNKCVSAALMARFAKHCGITEKQAAHVIIATDFNLNDALALLEAKGIAIPPNSYSLTAVEMYEPECFSIVTFSLPSIDMVEDPDVHDAMHELVLSAAEMPPDSTREELTHRFNTEWTTESDENCGEVMARFGAKATGVLMLPLGDYSTNGMHVMHPVSEAAPNIGTSVCAVSIELKTGVHSRFRFHAERIADTVAEHVAHEATHYGQPVHILKQPFWWNPNYSVEDFVRYKEALLQPSALMHEMRYAYAPHGCAGVEPYRNMVELEALKSMQFKLGKHYKENATPGNVFTQSGNTVINASMGNEGSGYGKPEEMEHFSDIARMERVALSEAGVITKSERIWRKFYTNNFF